mgnify:CR=1 FL=1
MMRLYFRQASEAYNSDQKAEAKRLSLLGRDYEATARSLNEQVSKILREPSAADEAGRRKQAECERVNQEIRALRDAPDQLMSE